MRITILGAGVFGTALSKVLTDNNHETRFFDPPKYPDISLSDAIADAEALLLAVPSNLAPALLQQIPNKNLPLINASKGFLSLAPFQDFPNFSILSGASFAKDLEEKRPTILTATAQLPIDLFQSDWLKVEYSKDNLGVLLCGTFKNIYAIGAGQKHLRPNIPEFRAYIDTALTELQYLLAANNCDPATVNLSCGKLDLAATCASKDSRNYQFGEKLTEHNHLDLSTITATTEGLSALQSLPAANLALPAGCETLHHIIESVHHATK